MKLLIERNEYNAGHLEPSPSESSDSDVEVTKDLENSMLMQSLLDPSSPTFIDRPLPDSLFSDEDSEKVVDKVVDKVDKVDKVTAALPPLSEEDRKQHNNSKIPFLKNQLIK